ncbi:hypothetical protein [Flyfo siphovirus Tbat2_3]|nr:hypothetical protein [Flyfo siphovirus Tbat2_3]
MGLMIRSNVKITDVNAPMIKVYDKILTRGSLALFDTANPMGGWGSGVPADGASIENLALDFIKPLISVSSEAAYHGIISHGAGLTTAKARFERTACGGLHGIVSQSQSINAGEGFALSIPAGAKRYIVENPNNSYFISVWKRQTRSIRGLTDGERKPAFMSIASYPGVDSNYLAVFSKNGLNMANRIGYRGTGADSDLVVNWQGVFNCAGTGLMGTPPELTGDVNGYATAFARPLNGNSTITGHPSFVFYRFYMEDLTVSGRTYAEVDALDQEMFSEAFDGITGRYRGDTFSSPDLVLL